MRFYRLPRWLSATIFTPFPRRNCCRERPFVGLCSCKVRKPVMLGRDISLETRESPTALFGPNPLASSLGVLSMAGLAAAQSSSLAEPSWHSPASATATERQATVVRDSVAAKTSEISETSEVSTHGANAPRSGAENWTALSSSILDPLSSTFSSADTIFGDPIALDSPFALVRHSGTSFSAGAFDDANLHSSVTDEGSSSGGGGSSGADVSSGAGGVSPLSQPNPLAGLVNSGPVISNNPGVNTPGSPANIILPPGVVPPSAPGANATRLAGPVANAPGSPIGPISTNHSPLTNTGDHSPLTNPQAKPPGPNFCLPIDNDTTTNVTNTGCGAAAAVFVMNQCPT